MGVREDIVAYCKEVIGCDYDYTPSGGTEWSSDTGWGSYNCSYLSFCAYRSAGVRIPTWQGHQNGDGSQSDWVRWNGNWTTDPDELKDGDLVFFGSSPYNTGHVGVSLGGWRMIDSVPNGGVQERTLYESFVGGGWPLDWYPDEHEDEPEEPVQPITMESDDMDILITITDKNTVVWMHGDHVHDLTDPEDIKVLDAAYAACHDGKTMPRLQLTADWYGRLCQCTKAGYPKHLDYYTNKFKPRS